MHNQNPQPPGPAVSPSRTVFQRLTNELPRNFPCPFGHTPVMFHFARFHAIPRKTPQTAKRPNTCPPQELQTPAKGLCHLMSPSIAAISVASRAPAGRMTQETSGVNPRNLAAAHRFDVLIFWRSDVSSPSPRSDFPVRRLQKNAPHRRPSLRSPARKAAQRPNTLRTPVILDSPGELSETMGLHCASGLPRLRVCRTAPPALESGFIVRRL